VDFWEKKFVSNIERDRQNVEALERLGWRIMVVWECEVLKATVATIRRVATWLQPEKALNEYTVCREELLAVAEKKVRYRIASYDSTAECTEIASDEEGER